MLKISKLNHISNQETCKEINFIVISIQSNMGENLALWRKHRSLIRIFLKAGSTIIPPKHCQLRIITKCKVWIASIIWLQLWALHCQRWKSIRTAYRPWEHKVIGWNSFKQIELAISLYQLTLEVNLSPSLLVQLELTN